MEKRVEMVVIQCVEEVMKSKEGESSDTKCELNFELERQCGIDSLGFIDLLLALEEKFQIELNDAILAQIRSCKYVDDLVKTIDLYLNKGEK